MCRHGRTYILFTAGYLFSIVLISYSYLSHYVCFLTFHTFFESSPIFTLWFWFLFNHSRETQANLIYRDLWKPQQLQSQFQLQRKMRLLSALSWWVFSTSRGEDSYLIWAAHSNIWTTSWWRVIFLNIQTEFPLLQFFCLFCLEVFFCACLRKFCFMFSMSTHHVVKEK